MDARLIIICLQCANPNGACNGVCPCPQDNKNILSEHAGTALCPIGKFDAAIADPNYKPEPPKKDIHPVPSDQWPRWAVKIKSKFSKPQDVGVGATVKRMTGKWGDRFTTAMKAVGLPCKCADREEEWNRRYPYV